MSTTDSIGWLIDLANRADVQRILLNCSFVTDIIEPKDVDCVLLIGPGPSKDPRVRRLSMISIKRLINQLTEEITRFESSIRNDSGAGAAPFAPSFSLGRAAFDTKRSPPAFTPASRNPARSSGRGANAKCRVDLVWSVYD
jgi:hypothetical protein